MKKKKHLKKKKQQAKKKQAQMQEFVTLTHNNTTDSKPEINDKKKNSLLYRILLMILSPIVFLLILEAGLRVAGFGYPTSLFIKKEIQGTDYYIDNKQFSSRFFPGILTRIAEPFNVLPEKPPETVRVVVLGASAARGDPDPSFGFSRILKIILEEKYKPTKVEVINTAITAINSNVVIEIAKECKILDPDYIVVYLGNNEVIGPYGPGTIFTPFLGNYMVIRFSNWIRTFKISQAIQGITEGLSKKSIPEGWGGMAMFSEHTIRSTDPDMKNVYNTYKQNLKTITREGIKMGAKVILCTVGSNIRDCAPFGSLHRPDMSENDTSEWTRLYEKGKEIYHSGDYAEALTQFSKALSLDDSYAELHFLMGRLYDIMKDYTKARVHYEKARDLDTLRFRADTPLNTIIHELEKEFSRPDVVIADVDATLNENAPDHIPGENFFYEHVHFNFPGNYVAAQSIMEKIKIDLGRNDLSENTGRGVLSLEECRKRLAMTEWEELKIFQNMFTRFQNPPFTSRIDNEQIVKKLGSLIPVYRKTCMSSAEESYITYKDALVLSGGDLKILENFSYFILSILENPREALKPLKTVTEKLPHNFDAHKKLGLIYMILNEYENALSEFKECLSLIPYSPLIYSKIGSVYGKLGEFEKAHHYFSRAFQLKSDSSQLYMDYAAIFELEGKNDLALEQYLKALELDPNMAEVHNNIGFLYIQSGDREKAIFHFSEAVRINPHSLEALNNLAKVQADTKKYDMAIKNYYSILEINENIPIIHYNLGLAFMESGNSEKALFHLQRAFDLDPGLTRAKEKIAELLHDPGLRRQPK